MASKKDKYTKPICWDKHLRKEGKRLYWKKSRAKAKELLRNKIAINGNNY